MTSDILFGLEVTQYAFLYEIFNLFVVNYIQVFGKWNL